MVDHEKECKDFAEYTAGPIRKDKITQKDWCLYMFQSPANMWFIEKKVNFCPFCGVELNK